MATVVGYSRRVSKDKRRQYGSGSLYQRASDGLWIGTIQAGHTPTGTRRRVTVSAKTEGDARRKLDARRRQIDREGLPSVDVRASATVRTWATTWLERTQRTARPKTWGTNASQVRRWIIPTIGRRKLTDLTPADIRAVTTAITDAGRSTSSAQRAQAILSKMLKDAILEGHAVPQRVLLVPAPARAVNDRDALPLDDAVALLGAAADHAAGSRWVAALLQGMRQGECLGLTWSCIDLDDGVLDVSWQLQALPYRVARDRASGFRVPDGYESRQLTGALHLVRPKSESGARVIPLVPWMTAALTAWRAVAPPSAHGLVWPRPDGEPMRAPADDQAWYALQDAAQVARVDGTVGRRYTIHEARHTTATLLLEAGVDPHVVTAIIGHSSIVTTRGYQHVSSALARTALEGVATRLGLTAA